MYDLYFFTTPNGYKPLILLEELSAIEPLTLKNHLIHIGRDEQFDPNFLKISPNNKIPALVDHAPRDGGEPIPMFESGEILLYLAEKHGAFLPTDLRGRTDVLTWLFWQMGGLGPMLGQNHHFNLYAKEKIPYAINRYVDETRRLYGVLDQKIGDKAFMCGEYSIADIACYPWCRGWEDQSIDIDQYPNVKRWLATMDARPAVINALNVGQALVEASN